MGEGFRGWDMSIEPQNVSGSGVGRIYFGGAGALYVRKLWKMRRSSCQVERLRPFAYLWENTSLDRRYLHWPGISWHSCSGDKCFYSQAASPSQTSHATITLDSTAWSILTDPFYKDTMNCVGKVMKISHLNQTMPTLVLELENSSMCCYLALVERLLDQWGILKHFPQSRCILISHWSREKKQSSIII